MSGSIGFQKTGPLLGLWFLVFLISGILLQAPVNAAPVSGKLRVFVQPISGWLARGAWPTPDEEFVRQQYRIMEMSLTQKGVYEVIPEAEVRAALKGKTVPGWKWKSGDWSLAKETGRMLGADYAMIMERGYDGFFYMRMMLINLTTGRQFDVQDQVAMGIDIKRRYHELWKESYRRIFQQAKGDMLATAIRKGGLTTEDTAPKVAPSKAEPSVEATVPRESPSPPSGRPAGLPPSAGAIAVSPPALPATSLPSPSFTKPAPPLSGGGASPPAPPSAKKPAVTSAIPPVADEKMLKSQTMPMKAAADRTRLIVYDFDAAADLHVAGLILSEALREELHQIGRFVLINREDMVKALEEHKLKMAGLVEEGGSAELGKWLMAGEIVTGKLARLGGASILQTKRTDLQTMSTRAVGSLKCSFGKEEELLDGMPDLARRLVEAR